MSVDIFPDEYIDSVFGSFEGFQLRRFGKNAKGHPTLEFIDEYQNTYAVVINYPIFEAYKQ